MQRLRPDEFNPLLDQLAQTHCPDERAWHALERMRETGELNYRGTRRHRGNLCPKCVFYRRVSDADEACDAYAKWLVTPPGQAGALRAFYLGLNVFGHTCLHINQRNLTYATTGIYQL